MATMKDPGRELFERFKAEGWVCVERWKADAEPETLHLEFKLKEKPGEKGGSGTPLEQADKANIAEALSAFANMEGGMLVIGVHATGGGKRAPDRVANLVPVDDVEAVAGEIQRCFFLLTDPRIGGVDIAWAKDSPTSTKGVVAIYVPPSRGGPHRATEAAGKAVNGRYFMRTADNTILMPHTTLADRFGRVAQPALSLLVRFVAVDQLQIRLANTGRGAARNPAVQFFDPPTVLAWPSHGGGRGGFQQTIDKSADGETHFLYVSGGALIVYPETDVIVFPLWAPKREPFKALSLTFRVGIHALDTQPVYDEGTIGYETHDGNASIVTRALVLGGVA